MSRRRELEVYDGSWAPPPVPPPTPLPPPMPPPPKAPVELGDFEFAVYDIVRRTCERDTELHEAHQTDVASTVILEGLADDDFYHVVAKVRVVLDWLAKQKIIRLKPRCSNTFEVCEDLLTVFSRRL